MGVLYCAQYFTLSLNSHLNSGAQTEAGGAHQGLYYLVRIVYYTCTPYTHGQDYTVVVWDMSPRDITLRKVLRGHNGHVSAVDVDETYIVSGSMDGTIKVHGVVGVRGKGGRNLEMLISYPDELHIPYEFKNFICVCVCVWGGGGGGGGGGIRNSHTMVDSCSSL